MGISGNPIDIDLTENNIRSGVDIFGVEGDFSGGIGTLAVGKSINMTGNVVTIMPQYMVPVNYFSVLYVPSTGFVLNGNNLIVLLGRYNNTIGNYTASAAYSIDMNTGAITYITAYSASAITDLSFHSMYYENDIIYRNYDWNDGGTHYLNHYELDTTTLVSTGPFAGAHTTGTILPDSLVVGGKTFSIQPLLGGQGLRTGNSGNDQISRTGILVS